MASSSADSDVSRLQAIFQAAMDFGLTDEQVWESAREVCDRTPPDKPASECFDEVAAALAAGITEGEE